MKCEITKQETCNLGNFCGILIDFGKVSKEYETREKLMEKVKEVKKKHK
jgi:hypothetical protein